MKFYNGDILVFSGTGLVSQIIRWGTWSPYSHVGICCEHDNEMLMWESTSLADRPCEIQGERISGVQAHRPYKVLSSCNARAWVLRARWVPTQVEEWLLWRYLHGHLGYQYDYREAVRSGTMFWKYLIPGNEDKLFCSEFVAEALKVVGHVDRSWDTSNLNPGELVEHLTEAGIYSKPERIK